RSRLTEAFRMADDILRQGVQGVSDIITIPGLINVDFADVKAIMQNAGSAIMGIGMAAGDNRAVEAAEQAIASPLLESGIEGARVTSFPSEPVQQQRPNRTWSGGVSSGSGFSGGGPSAAPAPQPSTPQAQSDLDIPPFLRTRRP